MWFNFYFLFIFVLVLCNALGLLPFRGVFFGGVHSLFFSTLQSYFILTNFTLFSFPLYNSRVRYSLIILHMITSLLSTLYSHSFPSTNSSSKPSKSLLKRTSHYISHSKHSILLYLSLFFPYSYLSTHTSLRSFSLPPHSRSCLLHYQVILFLLAFLRLSLSHLYSPGQDKDPSGMPEGQTLTQSCPPPVPPSLLFPHSYKP